jgi:hypothetical protein
LKFELQQTHSEQDELALARAAARLPMEHVGASLGGKMHSNFYRGQHPHAMNNFMQDTGPETWTNPIEIGRIHWEHRHLGELAEGFDPLTHYDPAIPAGQDLATRNRIKNHEAILKSKQAAYASTHAGVQQASVWMPKASSRSPPRNPFDVGNEGQRLARVEQLVSKLGVDKVVLAEKRTIDTSPQAGHHTAALPAGVGEGKTVLRGAWPTTERYYANAGGR